MVALRRFRIPLRTSFRGLTFREGVLIQGEQGWGECSPWPGLYDETTAMHAATEAATRSWPAAQRSVVAVHATIPGVSAEEAHAMAKGWASVKVKVAEGDDDARLEAVRDAIGPSGRIRIDANGAWTADVAVDRIHRYSRYGIELVEQPCPTIEGLREVRTRVDVPIAADESARPESADQLKDAADALVLKVQALGGVYPALELVDQTGLPGIVSSPLETSIGIAAGLALAAALPELPFACGLATIDLLDGDVVDDPLRPANGVLVVRRPTVDREALARYEVSDA